jgi:hypothetical protein
VFVVSASIDKGSHVMVLERSYADLKDSFFVYSPMLSQQDVIYWLFFSKDVFALDSVIKRIECYPGVRKVDVIIPINIEYHKDILIKEIERMLADIREGSLRFREISNIAA